MITFVGMKSRTSGKIRGQQIAKLIPGSNFFDWSEIHTNLEKIHKHVIIVRNRSSNVESFLKNRGHIIGFDVLDTVSSDLYFRNTQSDYSSVVDSLFNFYIVNNNLASAQLSKIVGSQNVFIIPHHHLNFNQKRYYAGEDITTAGYLGLPEQLTNYDEIASTFKKHNIRFITNPGNDYNDCLKMLKNIQVGIVNMNNKFSKTFRECKPNTKLTNYQSFGIITLCNESESFRQFGDNQYLKHENLNQLEKNLNLLLGDSMLRCNISDKGFENSKKYHIKEVVKLYVNMVEQIKR